MRTAFRPLILGLVLASLLTARPVPAVDSVWGKLPARLAADSLAPALRRLESLGPRSTAGGAAFALGQFHLARGEYRSAAEAFGRAAARLTGYDRADARYRQGLAWLGAQDGGRARAAFEDVSAVSQPLRPFAQLGLARAFALLGEPAREQETLRRLLDGPAGEAEPAALERYATLCERAHRAAEAVAARDRLRRRWPRSMEAARLGLDAQESGVQP